MMKEFTRVLLLNLGIMAVYGLYILWQAKAESGHTAAVVLAGFGFLILTGIHALLAFLIGLILLLEGEREKGAAALVSAILVVLIGISGCSGYFQ